MNITIDTTIHFTPDGTEKFDAPFMRKAAQYIEANGLDDWDLKVRDGWDQTAKGAGKSRRVPIGYTLTKVTNETVGGAADVEPSNGVQRERDDLSTKGETPEQRGVRARKMVAADLDRRDRDAVDNLDMSKHVGGHPGQA